MLPADKNNPDAANAAHGINVYRNDVSAPVPAGSKQAGNRAFTQHDGVWDTTSNVRTQKGFETESAKDAFTKIKQIKIVDNEQQELMNQMSMIVMEAVQAKVATPYLYALWLDLSLGLVDWGTKAQQGDAAATKLLTNKFNKFIGIFKSLEFRVYPNSINSVWETFLVYVVFEEKLNKKNQINKIKYNFYIKQFSGNFHIGNLLSSLVSLQ